MPFSYSITIPPGKVPTFVCTVPDKATITVVNNNAGQIWLGGPSVGPGNPGSVAVSQYSSGKWANGGNLYCVVDAGIATPFQIIVTDDDLAPLPGTTVTLSPGSVVNLSGPVTINGPVDVTGSSNLGISTFPSPSVPATNTASHSFVGATSSTAQLLNNSTLNPYILISLVMNIHLSTSSVASIQLTGTESDTLWQLSSGSYTISPISLQIDLSSFKLSLGAGVEAIYNPNQSSAWDIIVYYTTAASSGVAIPAFSLGG